MSWIWQTSGITVTHPEARLIQGINQAWLYTPCLFQRRKTQDSHDKISPAKNLACISFFKSKNCRVCTSRYEKVPEGIIGINMPANFVQDYGTCLSAKMTRWSKRQFTPPICLSSVLCELFPAPFLTSSEPWRDFGPHNMVTAIDTISPLCLCLLPGH